MNLRVLYCERQAIADLLNHLTNTIADLFAQKLLFVFRAEHDAE